MFQTKKRILSLVLGVSMMISLTACGTSKEQLTTLEDTSKAADMTYGQVWSAPSYVKVDLNDKEYAAKGEAVLSYEAVRNEYESCQLLITASKAIESFELQTEDLKNGENILSKDNISVYVEKYISYNDYSGSGDMPDALIPQETAAKYKENVIAKEQNGGLWVTVYVPKDTVEGTYEGNFNLVVTGEKGEETIDIPVSLKVHDYTLSDEVTAETLFSWRYDRVAAGELDGSIEMMTTYYDFFQEYRISLQSLPIETLSGEEYVAAVQKYYDQLTSYCILGTVGEISTEMLSKPEKVKEQVLAVAAASTPDKNLLEKAMMYVVDEPDFSNDAVRESVMDTLAKVKKLLQECVDTINADQGGTYAEFKKIPNWENSILNIRNVIPTGDTTAEWLIENENTETGQEVLNSLNCLCMAWGSFKTNLIEPMESLYQKYDIELWWYGCMYPYAPGATYHIGDDNLLSARTISWMQKKYNVVGNLYWDAAAYTDEYSERYNQYLNVFEYPYRKTNNDTMSFPAGDGFLTYPGASYGIYGPMPSMRLMSIRDGMEEYELLKVIEDEYTNIAASNKTLSVQDAMSTFYQNLSYSGYCMNADGENGLDFATLREQLLAAVTRLANGQGFVMGDIEVSGTMAEFRYYVQDGVVVAINDELQDVSGTTHQYQLDLDSSTDVKVTVTNQAGESNTFTQFVAAPRYELTSLSDASVLAGIKTSEGSSVEIVKTATYSTDGTSLHAKVNGVLTGNELKDETFAPYISVDTSLFGELQPSDLSTISFDLYNPGEYFSVKVRLYSGSSYAECGTYDVTSGKTTVVIDTENTNFKQMDSADRVAFEFVNAEEGKALSYEFYMDNVVGTKK